MATVGGLKSDHIDATDCDARISVFGETEPL